jgi:hypothetical protein
VALKDKLVFGTQEVYELIKEAEAETARRQSYEQLRKRRLSGKIEIEDEEIAEEPSSDLDSDYHYRRAWIN